MDWRFDLDAAKTGERIILAITGPLCGKMVLQSEWIAKEQRFSCIGKKNVVVAWMPWPGFPEMDAPEASAAEVPASEAAEAA